MALSGTRAAPRGGTAGTVIEFAPVPLPPLHLPCTSHAPAGAPLAARCAPTLRYHVPPTPTLRCRRIRVIHELRQLVEQKEQFIALMSHELRTPLNGIIGLSNVLLMDAGEAHLASPTPAPPYLLPLLGFTPCPPRVLPASLAAHPARGATAPPVRQISNGSELGGCMGKLGVWRSFPRL